MLQRRVLLAAMAASLATPAFAQTGTSPSKSAGENPAATSTANEARQANAGATMGAAEQKHLTDTMAAGAMSLAASRVAVKKVRDDDLMEFAKFEVAEQETIADVLMSMKDPGKASGKINPPSDTELRQQIAQQDMAAIEKMSQMDGPEFERAYIKAQVEGHQKLLQIQETYLSQGKNPAQLAVAKLARGQIKEHLALLADIGDDDDKRATTGRAKK